MPAVIDIATAVRAAAMRVKLRQRLMDKQPLKSALEQFCPLIPTAKQAQFLAIDCREALYGGAAGPGKSTALLMAALQYVDKPGYAALMLRRSFPDLSLPGALMDMTFNWLNSTAAQWHAGRSTWVFPSGATLTFGYLDHTQDKYRYQSSQFQFCVARGTRVLMADGLWRPIENIEIGDYVQTLEGKQKVQRVYALGKKPVARIKLPLGEVVVGVQHRLLTVFDGWASPLELLSKQCLPFGNNGECSLLKCGVFSSQPGYLYWGQLPKPGLFPRSNEDMAVRDSGVWRVSGQNEAVVSDGTCPIVSQPWRCRSLLVLYGQSPPLMEASASYCAACGVFPLSKLQDSPTGYRWGRYFCDALPQRVEVGAPGNIQRQGDVVKQSPVYWLPDGQENIHGYNLHGYIHPYTMECRPIHGDILYAPCDIILEGEAEVHDLTVSSCSHYIIYPGIISSNCGFDELTQFPESDYTFLFSRLRRLEGMDIPIRMRTASNPGNIGHDWVKARFMGGPNPDRVFIPATLADNPYLDRVEYEKTLQELDPITRQQLLRGDWSARQGGKKFKREWFEVVAMAPADCQKVRFWDMAATEAKPGKDPDWTVGALLGLSKQRILYVLDIRRMRGTPGQTEQLIKQTAELDGRETAIRMEQEPGSSGVKAIDDFTRRVLLGWAFKGIPSTGSKEVRANPLASQAEAGNIKLVRGAWLNAFLDEAELFPNGSHDDQIDASSGALAQLSRQGIAGGAITAEPKESKWHERGESEW